MEPLGRRRGVDSAAQTRGVGQATVVLLGLATLALAVLTLYALSSHVDLLRPLARGAGTRSIAHPARRSSRTAGSPKAETSPRRKTPRSPPRFDWPRGEPSAGLALIATNIPPRTPRRSTALLLDEQSERYVLLSPGDQVGDFEVVTIAMDWVQLRKGGVLSWVGYRERKQRRTGAPHAASRPPPPRVRRRPDEPKVTYKWIAGRLNLAGELEDHLRPTVTAQGVRVGRVTLGFRRIGMRVGDVVTRAGDRPVRSADDIREGLQPAARPGGGGSITVLRGGRSVQLDFGVQ